MSDKNDKSESSFDAAHQTAEPTKKQYTKPQIFSEELMTFGAVCNGNPGGGRKAATGAPAFCNASKIKS